MKKIKIILILVLTILISGCSYKELNDLAIASALGIDYENNEYIISAQIMELKKQEKEDTSSALIYLGKGKTISEALRNISLKYPNYLYLGHLELIIIGKGEINHGINNSLDYFIRTSDARNDALILVSTKNKAYEIINPNEETKEEFPVKDIVTTIKNSKERNGLVIEKNYEELINDYLEKGISQILTTIENEKDENDNYKDTILSNIAVFEKGKYVKDLNKESAISYNLINNNFDNVSIDIIYNNKDVSVSLIKPKCSLDLKLDNNKVTVNININVEEGILNINDKNILLDKNFLKDIENITKKKINSYINDLINFNMENNTDVLGLKNIIYKKYHKSYKKFKDKNIYEIAKININTNVYLYKYGNIYKSFSGGSHE